jgi:TolB-like protein/DNA-binding winged helix-turn-helix (wHTH) protein
MGKDSRGFYEFGQFRMDPARKILLRDGEPVTLTSKAFEMLQVLIERSDKVITKDELMKALWPDSFVEESNLTQHISVLRRALGETPQDHRYILTFPGRGYRFAENVRFVTGHVLNPDEEVAPLSSEGGVEQKVPTPKRPGSLKRLAWAGFAVIVLGASVVAGWWLHTARGTKRAGASADSGRRKMLAVLPFQNLSNDPAQEYFSDGLTEETITDLGELNPDKLGVIARTSAMAYKHTGKTIAQIGSELGADYVLEGSVRREAGTARVSAQLIRVNDQTHLWAHTYEREVTGLLALQSELGTAIAQQVQIELEPERGTRLTRKHMPNTESYEAYLQGLYFLNKRTYDDENKSVTFFEQSAQKDPGFAPAYAQLANAYLALSIFSPEHFFPLAAAAAKRALELDDDLAEAHAALGAEKADFEFDWQASDRELGRAIELNPNSALTHSFLANYYFTPLGKSEQSIAEIKKALELDPLSPVFNSYLGLDYFYARRYDEALIQYKKTVALYPDFLITHYWLAWLYSQRGQFPDAITEITKARLLEGGERAKMAPTGKIALTDAYAANGPKGFWEQIQKANEKTGRNFGEFDIPQVYARLGEKDLALEWLGRNYESRTNFTTYMNVDPAYDSMRSDPRFENLARRIGLIR